MSRILTLMRVNEKDAIKITLDLKKHFVESHLTDITQADLEQVLFQKLHEFNNGDRLVQRYQLVTKFYQKRAPIIIIVCGTECMGKSTLVTQLAERVNISNILQTTVVKQVMQNFSKANGGNLGDESVDGEDVVQKYRNECLWVRDGCNFDISKIFKDGKPLIIDGTHVDPYCFIDSFEDEQTGKITYRIITKLTAVPDQHETINGLEQ